MGNNNQARSGALDGILVLDHTSALAGPYCAQLLGDLGAEVIKLERPGAGDQSRGWGPPFVNGESAYYLGTNRNKRSLTLNLGAEAGRQILHQLVERADVLLHNVPKASSRQKLGLDEETCHALNPRLIWASISGFGNTGPYAERPGYDVIAQAMSGTMHLTGDPDGGPARFPTPIADITTGMYTALAIVSALFARERTRQGQTLDLALLDSQITWLANVGSSYLITGEPPQKQGNAHPNIATYQPFQTADGWIIIGAGSEKLWLQLVELLGVPELAQDARFETNAERMQHRDVLIPLLNAQTRQRTTAEWQPLLTEAGIPNDVINPPEKTLKDPHLLAREMIVELEHPAVGRYKMIGNPMKFDDTPITYRRPAPMLGQHTREILADLGYDEGQITRLVESGVV
ncbi:MAG: CoA transferase [Anaerolineae bacterium]|nr:CoA transferase [Anaerolineae bacterium]